MADEGNIVLALNKGVCYRLFSKRLEINVLYTTIHMLRIERARTVGLSCHGQTCTYNVWWLDYYTFYKQNILKLSVVKGIKGRMRRHLAPATMFHMKTDCILYVSAPLSKQISKQANKQAIKQTWHFQGSICSCKMNTLKWHRSTAAQPPTGFLSKLLRLLI